MYIPKSEKRNVRLILTKDDLSFYDARGNFVFEDGGFEFEIDSSSKDIHFSTKQYVRFDRQYRSKQHENF